MKNLESTLEKVGKILAKRHNITVTCRGTSCCTNGKTITLPAIPDELPPVLERSINGYLDHEVGHILHSDFEVIKPFKETHGEKGFDVLNICEDARVNRVMGAQYIGAGMNITAANEYVHKKITDAGTASNMSPWQKLSMGLCSRALGLDSSIFGSEVNEVVDTLSDELTEIPHLKSTQDSMDLAIRIIAKLFPPEEEEPQSQEGETEPQQDEQSSQENSENSNGEPSSSPAAPDEQKDDKQADPAQDEGGDNEDETSSEEDPAGGQGEDPGKQKTPSKEPETGDKNLPSGSSQFLEECRLDESNNGNAMAALIEEEINAIASNKTWRVYDSTLDRVIKPKAKGDSAYKALLDEVKPYISGLRQKLMLTLKGRRACRWIGDQDEGLINQQRLSGLITGTSSKVFKVKHVEEAKSIAVSLLIDCSGSMRGERLNLATKLAIAFSECLHDLNIPHEVIGFNTSNRPEKYLDKAKQETGMSEEELLERFTRFVPLRLTVFKEFSESFKAARGRFPLMKAGGLTPLHESMMFAARRLAARPESRHVLLVCSDGFPEIYPSVDSMVDEAIKAVSKINTAGIETIGIGIQSSCVEEIFPKYAVINDLSELPKSFFRELSKVLTK